MPPLRPIKIYITLSRGNRVTQLTISWYGTGPCSPRHREKIRFALLLLKSCHVIESFRVSFRRVSFFFPSPPFSFFFLPFFFSFFFNSFFFFFSNETDRKEEGEGREGEELVFGEPSLRYASSFDTFLKRFTSPRIRTALSWKNQFATISKGKGSVKQCHVHAPVLFSLLFLIGGGGENISHIASPSTEFQARTTWKEESKK